MQSAAQVLISAACLRVALVLLGFGEYLAWRFEVSTPLNSLLSVRECATLDRLLIAPYTSSSCRIPPLLVRIVSATCFYEHAFLLPNLLFDLTGGWMLKSITAKLAAGTQYGKGQLLSPGAVMAMFLFNPFTVASCISGSLSPLENLLIIAAVHRGIMGDVPGAAFAVVAAAYTGLHPVLLLVPVGLLAVIGPEDALGTRTLGSCTAHGSTPDTGAQHEQTDGGSKQSALACMAGRRLCLSHLVAFMLWAAVWAAALMAISDIAMQHHPSACCIPPMRSWLSTALALNRPAASTLPDLNTSQGLTCWVQHVYRLHVTVEDQTPNIGQMWYFFTELFPNYRPFFRFVTFSLAAMFAIPLSLRFPQRPLLVITAQVLLICMFKPYPSVADHALYLALISLLQKQMSRLKIGLLLVNTFLLLAVLCVTMWHQWINVESANSNFLYSITLLIGAWQTLLLVQLVLLTITVECEERGKAGKDA